MPAKISIITPSFNQGKYLEETICSILDQQYSPLEYIIIDGGSTDQSVDIIKKYSSRLSYWISEKDSGQSDAINKGLKKATGEIVTWIASDDLLMPCSLSKVAAIFDELPQSVGVIHGNTEIFSDKKAGRIDKGYAVQNLERRLSGMAFSQPSSFIRKSFLNQAGLLNVNYHYGMDYDLLSRLALLCDFKYVDELFSKYRLHKESKTQSSNGGFNKDWIAIFNNIVHGLNLEFAQQELRINSLELAFDPNSNQFFESFINKKTIDQKLLSFYFLSYVLKYDYWDSNFKRARRLAPHLKDHYKEYVATNPEVDVVVNRLLKYPDLIIGGMRKLKRIVTT